MKKKDNISYWNFLSAGTNGKKTKWIFEICPGVGFLAVSLGRTRKRWFSGTEHFIMYRNNISKPSNIFFDWIPESMLIERD